MRAILAAILIGNANCSPAAVPMESKVAQLIEKTRTTTAAYSVVTWNKITVDGKAPVEEWAAEFHLGSLHRVETPRDRIVADCAMMKGTHLNVATGTRSNDDWIAKAACGINANKPISDSRWLGRFKTKLGMVDRVKLVDDDNIRTYDVADNGSLLAATIADLNGTMRLVSTAIDVQPSVSDAAIFSPSSLETSAVPDRFKTR
jgi:hypothetical protein